MYYEGDRKAIIAWDLARVEQMLGYSYVLGYISTNEYVTNAVAVGKAIQNEFTSWEDYGNYYIDGYRYWVEIKDYPDYCVDWRDEIFKSFLEDDRNGLASPYNISFYTELTDELSQ